MPIYNGYPQVYYSQQPQGQLEQLTVRAPARHDADNPGAVRTG